MTQLFTYLDQLSAETIFEAVAILAVVLYLAPYKRKRPRESHANTHKSNK